MPRPTKLGAARSMASPMLEFVYYLSCRCLVTLVQILNPEPVWRFNCMPFTGCTRHYINPQITTVHPRPQSGRACGFLRLCYELSTWRLLSFLIPISAITPI